MVSVSIKIIYTSAKEENAATSISFTLEFAKRSFICEKTPFFRHTLIPTAVKATVAKINTSEPISPE